MHHKKENIMESNNYAAPEAELETNNNQEAVLASRWARLGAAIIDGLIMIPFAILVTFLFVGSFDMEAMAEQSLVTSFVMGLINIALFFVIHGKVLFSSGQTWGKRLAGIKIVKMSNEQADNPTLIKRYAFYFGVSIVPLIGGLLSLINILCIFAGSKRCLHDHVAGTQVVNA